MGYLINPIRHFLESSFTILPELGNNMNVVLMAVGGIAGLIWISLMLKYEGKETNNR